MGSFLKSFRKDVGSTAPAVGVAPPKKELQPLPMTPLEKMLMELGPIREDGSDKFFGMENYGNTCYCNSILQCLYYSVPFREAVLNYPKRTPIESLEAALAKSLRYQDPNARLEAEALAEKQKVANPPRPGQPPNPQQKPEDKDSPEYKKKIALQTLPLLETANNSDSYAMSESLFTSMKDIFESVVGSHTRIGIIRPQHFLDVLRREHEMFRTAMHQDAHEFLNLLLNAVVTNVEDAAKDPTPSKLLPADESSESLQPSSSSGLKTPNTTRWVHELFEGLLTSETQCLTCEKVSQRDEVFLDLSVDLEQHSSVTSCLRKFSAEEMLCERNKFHCDNCGGLQEAEKRMKIKRLPRVLALHLKRFKYTEDLQKLQKLFHRVVYPYHLRLFNTTDDAEDPDRLYELYAVVVHIGGGPYHGHYVAIIKTEDRGWLLFDDEMVEPVDKNYVRNFFGDKPGLACAYVLFYQETTMEAVMKEQEQENMEPLAEANTAIVKHNGFAHSPALAHVHSASQVPVPEEHDRFTGLKRAPTAPQLSTHYENAYSEKLTSSAPAQTALTSLPPVPPIPETPPSPLKSRKSDLQSRKERAREEKERKAAEKEKEKQRRKEIESSFRDRQRREEAELKAALEASKATKVEEDRRNHTENGSSKKSPGGLGRFRSISHRLGKDKESRTSLPPLPSLPNGDHSSSKVSVEQAQPEILRKPLAQPPSQPLSPPPNNHAARPSPVETPTVQPEQQDTIRSPKNDRSSHGKWRSFSIRKKSFNILSS
ncbi:ubiquitin C-terminal hydrolase CreB [Aspergillus lucknowensis]|uniref:Ubiquitin carboxyl-terminal hydrolase n=1 Tax=Aspergillus lucknowensis TaxID=176173 RepID=A0ABR4L8K8_9EURO